jgi:hypothetical protein
MKSGDVVIVAPQEGLTEGQSVADEWAEEHRTRKDVRKGVEKRRREKASGTVVWFLAGAAAWSERRL